MKASEGNLSREIKAKLMHFQKGRCAICKCNLKKVETHIDHIVPLAKGGANSDRNVQLLCRDCNQSKGAMMPEDYMRTLGYLL